MKNTNKRIIRLVAAVMLIALMTVSLSSCLFDFGFSYGDYLPDFDYDYNDDNQGGYQPLPNLGGSTGNEITSENYGEFYPGSGQGNTDNLTPMAKTLLSTVTIICSSGMSSSAGSGVIYSVDREKGDAYIITNQHVVHNASTIEVYLYGMQLTPYAIPATYIGGSVTYDIAVIKVSGSEVIRNSYARAVEFADSDQVRVYDRVYAVGNPEGSGIAATEGIVSVVSESINITGADGSLLTMRVMRVDAAVNHGNSGGGLYDENGKFIGTVSAKEVSEDIDNMGYAIPSNLVKSLASSIISQCNGTTVVKLYKPLMGITITAYVSGVEIDKNGEVYQVEMVEVIEIASGSLAEGKIMVGDVINSITVDGVKHNVTKVHHVTDAMIGAKKGSVVTLNVTRGGVEKDITFNIRSSDLTVVK